MKFNDIRLGQWFECNGIQAFKIENEAGNCYVPGNNQVSHINELWHNPNIRSDFELVLQETEKSCGFCSSTDIIQEGQIDIQNNQVLFNGFYFCDDCGHQVD